MYGNYRFKKEKLWPVLGWFLLVLLLTASVGIIGALTYIFGKLGVEHWGDQPYMDYLFFTIMFDIMIAWRIVLYWILSVYMFIESIWKVYGCWDWRSTFYLGILTHRASKVPVKPDVCSFKDEEIRSWWRTCMGWHPILYYNCTYYFLDKKKAMLFKLKWG